MHTNNRFRKMFLHKHVILPVIHTVNQKQAYKNADLAYNEGCDGVFLIYQSRLSCFELFERYQFLSIKYLKWWLGVNCLDLDPIDTFYKVPKTVAGIWVDNAMIDETAKIQNEADTKVVEKG